jgi:succinate dehydrogenase/fumarate reductase cytochrome b subunit
MESDTQGDAINPWGVELFHTIQAFQPRTSSQDAAYAKWLDETSERESARSDRIHGAVGVIPLPLWLVLLLTSVVIFVYLLFFADSGEGAVTQAVLMGSVAAVLTMMLLLISFLDQPFHTGVGGIRPVAMERTLDIIDLALQAAGESVTPPCDAAGRSTS